MTNPTPKSAECGAIIQYTVQGVIKCANEMPCKEHYPTAPKETVTKRHALETEPIGTDCPCEMGSEKHYHPSCPETEPTPKVSECCGAELVHLDHELSLRTYCSKCKENTTPQTPSEGKCCYDTHSPKEKCPLRHPRRA